MQTTLLHTATALLLIAGGPIATAQVPNHRYEFVQIAEPTDYRTSMLSWSERAANDEYMVNVDQPTTGKGSDEFHLYAYSKETGALVSQMKFGKDWHKSRGYDNMLFLNDRLYVTSELVNYKTGQVDFIAQEFELPQLALKGDAITFATINFNPKGMMWDRRRAETFFESPDGEHICFYYDRIRTAENEQLVMLFMMDGNMQPQWQQGYRIPFESDKISTAGVEVSNNGIVYALMNSKFKNRAITNKDINYSYQLVGMSGKAMVTKPIEFSAGYTALKANLVLKGNAPRVGGFFVKPDQSIKETAGYFIVDFDEKLEGSGTMTTHSYSAPLQHQLMKTDLLQRADGGCYLIGGAWEVSATALQERLLVVNSVGPDGTNEWTTEIPRRLKTNSLLEEHGYLALLPNDKLMLLIPDDEDNLSHYRSGGQPKLTTATKRAIITIGFSDSGKASFNLFKEKGPYELWLDNVMTRVNTSKNLYVCAATKMEGKKSGPFGFLYLNFKD